MKNFKTTFCFLVIILCVIPLAHSQKEVTTDFENYNANMDILRGYVTALKAGDAVKLSSYFADNAIIVGLGSTIDTISKKDHLERYTETFKVDKMDITQDIYLSVKTNEDAAVAPGEYSFSWGTVTSTNKATKKTATSRYHVVAQIVDGKMTFLSHYYDLMPFALRDGATLSPPKKM